MANETRVDLLLRLRTALEGDKEALAYLDGFATSAERGARHVSDEWDKLGRKLERKFSLPDIGYELLRGFGAGSGFALIEHAVGGFLDSFKEKAKAAADAAKTLATQMAAVSAGYDALAGKKTENFLATLTPDRRIAENNKRLDQVNADIADQQARYNTAAEEIAKAGTASAALMTFIRGSSVEGNWENRYKLINRDEPAKEETQARVDRLMAANKRLLELQTQREDLTKSIYTDEKAIADQNSRINDAIDKADAAAAIATQKKKYEDMAAVDAKAHDDRITRLKGILGEEQDAFDKIIADQKKKNDKAEADRKAASKAELASAIDANQDALRGYAEELAKIDSSPFLSDQEKRAQRIIQLRKENEEIDRQIALWRKFAAEHPEIDPASVRAQIRGLQDRSTQNIRAAAPPATLQQNADIALRDMGVGKNADGSQAKVDPSKHFTSAADGIGASLKQQIAEIGTFGDQINRAFANVGQSIRTSLGGAFADMVLKAGSFKSKVVGFGNAIATSFVQITAQMAADWIYQHTIMAAWKKLFTAQDVATTAAAEGTKVGVVAAGQGGQTAAHGAGATARGAISVGETIFHGIQVAIRTAAHIGGEILKTAVTIAQSAIRIGAVIAESIVYVIEAAVGALAAMSSIPYVGPFLGLAAMGAVLAAGMGLVKREMGGPVTAGQPYLVGEKRPEIFVPHTDGFIIPSVAQAMTRPGYAPPSGGGSGGGGQAGGGGGGRPVHVYPLLENDSAGREAAERNPWSDAQFVSMLKKHRRVLGVKV